jgi:hypothetical protein
MADETRIYTLPSNSSISKQATTQSCIDWLLAALLNEPTVKIQNVKKI